MESKVANDGVRVSVSSDRLIADLVIRSDFPPQMLTEELCLTLLRQAGIPIDEEANKAIRSLCEGPELDGADSSTRVRVATGQPAQHGRNGGVEWFDLDSEEAAADTDGDKEGYSHYDRKSVSTVAAGSIVGRSIEPTAGEDGRNVLGGVISAKPGKAADLRIDESIIKDADGNLVAQFDGILVKKEGVARICRKLDVPEYVDFSTGNIDFPGDVVVQRGVRDRFEVRATGDIEVRGLIEAASIICGGNFVAKSGMAGRERGTIEVAGDVKAKYLENVIGSTRGDISVDREIVNCELKVRGTADVTRGRIVGGVVAVAGAVAAGSIGSPAHVPTQLILGAIPELDAFVDQLTDLVEQLTEKREKLQGELEQINKNTRRLTPQQRERQTEIMFEVDQVDEKIKVGNASREMIEQRLAERKTVELKVQRQLHQGAVLTVDGRNYRVRRDIRGPLVVKLRGRKEVVCSQRGNDPVPLATIIKE